MQYRTPKAAPIRNLMVSVVAGILLLVAACEQAPKTLAPTMTGDKVDLAGPQWLVVNYWAEWCGPCRHEIPELNELDGSVAGSAAAAAAEVKDAQASGDANPVAVAVLGVNYDGLEGDKLIEVSDRMGISFAVLTQDPREQWAQPLPTVLPSTYLIAPGGEFVELLVGPQTRAGIISRIEVLHETRAASAL